MISFIFRFTKPQPNGMFAFKTTARRFLFAISICKSGRLPHLLDIRMVKEIFALASEKWKNQKKIEQLEVEFD